MADEHQHQPDPQITSAIAAAMAAVSPKVTYDVADLLDRMGTRIDQGFSEMKALMTNKADKSDVARMEARLDEHGKKIGSLEDWRKEATAEERAAEKEQSRRASFAQWRTSTWIAIGGGASGWAVLLYYLVH